jgi:hypothetical protein
MILKARPKADPLNAQQKTAKAVTTIHLCYHHPKPNQADAPHSIQSKQRKIEQRLITDMGTPRPFITLHKTKIAPIKTFIKNAMPNHRHSSYAFHRRRTYASTTAQHD